MKKEMTLPRPVDAYVPAIKEWAEREIFAVNVTLEIIEAIERDGQTIVTVKIDGTFDRAGLPDPLLMEHCFTVAGDKIAALTCRLAGEAPEAQGNHSKL